MDTYQNTLNWLYAQRAAYERQGRSGYKPGLANSKKLDELFGHPHSHYPTIHVAGTNGKGSTAHLIAAVLQAQGCRVGLYTSPHLVDFRERIRVDGQMIGADYVMQWVERCKQHEFRHEPSFFEMVSTMAFCYFKDMNVDVAVIETGLGGRLDSTNIILPVLSVITNVSLEHTDMLGHTLSSIAREKAGIIKGGAQAVIGEDCGRKVTAEFASRAHAVGTWLVKAYKKNEREVLRASHGEHSLVLDTASYGRIDCQLTGDYQVMNANTALVALRELGWHCRELPFITPEAVAQGFGHVCTMTGLQARWATVDTRPLTIIDSAHNVAGLALAMRQLARMPRRTLRMVVGFMADKDLATILTLLPRDAFYYFTQAPTARALSATKLKEMAQAAGLHGVACENVMDAYAAARHDCDEQADLIYVGGSMYVLGEFLSAVQKMK